MSFLRRGSVSKSAIEQVDAPLISPELIDLLSAFDAESLIIAASGAVLYSSVGIGSLNIVKDQIISSQPLLDLIRTVRRTNKSQEATLELPLGPIGAGMHDLFIKVSPLGDQGLISILIFDDSEARRLDSIRRDFVANISHELKTPIGALSILSEAVLGASDDPEAVSRFANRMQTEAKRLSDLVQEIINLSRLQDNDPLVDGENFSVTECAQEAIDQARINAENHRIEVVFDSNCAALARGDRHQITMAIHNLIENAINYSPEGTRVAVTIRDAGEICEVTISDQGIGIPEKDLERIFERFYRVDPARSRITGGTGLGLSIVKHIITNHGGDVSVWSKEGAGSTFTLRIPHVSENFVPENISQPEGVTS
jgi:two-component system sensor histidine kinase SenX3